MIFDIQTSIKGETLFIEQKHGDSWVMLELMDEAGFTNMYFIGCAKGYENCIVFENQGE